MGSGGGFIARIRLRWSPDVRMRGARDRTLIPHEVAPAHAALAFCVAVIFATLR